MKKTLSEMRVEIAKDVLAQLDEGKIEGVRGLFLELDPIERYSRYRLGKHKATPLKKRCSACAIGAVFIAAFTKHSNLTNGDLLDMRGRDMIQYLTPWFTEKQLRLMEVAFESFVPALREEVAASNFCKDLSGSDGDARLRKIMQNIVDNGGTFEP